MIFPNHKIWTKMLNESTYITFKAARHIKPDKSDRLSCYIETLVSDEQTR